MNGKAIVGTGPKGADVVAVGMTFNTAMQDRAILIFDNVMAPKGYAYLLIHEGYGTMATVLYREYRRADACFNKLLSFLKERMTLDIRNEKKFGGYGNFFMLDTQTYHKKICIGETAGFQDCLWGFGMRYAMRSGYLAAKSIIDSCDYDTAWRRELKPMLEISLVNRYLFEKLGDGGYRYMVKKFGKGNTRELLRRHYNPSAFKHLILPFAKRSYESRVRDKSCNHENCACVWCRCGEKVCA
jgi:flavin-dependent dehydrogenase